MINVWIKILKIREFIYFLFTFLLYIIFFKEVKTNTIILIVTNLYALFYLVLAINVIHGISKNPKITEDKDRSPTETNKKKPIFTYSCKEGEN